jgi:hypothetical protein
MVPMRRVLFIGFLATLVIGAALLVAQTFGDRFAVQNTLIPFPGFAEQPEPRPDLLEQDANREDVDATMKELVRSLGEADRLRREIRKEEVHLMCAGGYGGRGDAIEKQVLRACMGATRKHVTHMKP